MVLQFVLQQETSSNELKTIKKKDFPGDLEK